MKVLMSLMKLDLGGAETHVIELAKELRRRGWEVLVASNGGVCTDELESAGIRHYTVPLQNKNPKNVINAFKMLKKIIVDEKVDIVHSHARIPSFILGKLQKKMGFPFVTTPHGVFTTKYGLKYITDWGQKTLAVSEDIKKYLMDNYHIKEENIRLTINGIDTDKFSPAKKDDTIYDELGISPADNTIVYMSRMDKLMSIPALQLIEIYDRLAEKIENPKLVLVGGGDNFDTVKRLADEANRRSGGGIIVTGARSDAWRILGAAKLFVGVSRSALEAMAMEKPVILAGYQGFIGLFDSDRVAEAKMSNFCCRGCAELDKNRLCDEILRFFKLDKMRADELGRMGRELVITDYSVGRMTDDTESVYKSVL